MLSPTEREEIRLFIHEELSDIERQVRDYAGSYNFLCSVGGLTMFTHHPVGRVIHAVPHI